MRIRIKPDLRFTIKGNDLYLNEVIDIYTAVLGGEILVKTLTGQVKIPITAGTQNGKTIRLKGKGMPIYGKNDAFGDLYIQIKVQIPENLTEKQKELFTQLKTAI